MENLHIVSVGTSIIDNLRRRGVLSIPEGAVLEDWLKENRKNRELMDKAYESLRSRPCETSAEINSMWKFLENNWVDEVYLIATDTEAGAFCSDLLHRYLREEHSVRILGESGPLLGYYKTERLCGVKGPKVASDVFAEDLHKLFNAVINLIRRHKDRKNIYINATGGFKAEMAVLSLAGNLFLVPAYYLHQTFSEVVFLPPLIPPELFKEEIEVLREIYRQSDRRLVGNVFKDLYRAKSKLLKNLEKFKVIEISRDNETGEPYEVRLTPQGKFWVEVGNETG